MRLSTKHDNNFCFRNITTEYGEQEEERNATEIKKGLCVHAAIGGEGC